MSASFNVEVFVPQKVHYEVLDSGVEKMFVDRPAKLVAAEVGVYPKPLRAEVLRKYAKELEAAGIDFGSIEEVQISIVPFCG